MPEKKPEKAADVAAPTFAEVQRELTKALGKPKRKRGVVLRYKAPSDAKQVKAWVARVKAAGGVASLSEAYPARELLVADGPPSMLMEVVTYVSWQSKSARRLLDTLHAEAGITISNINYTGFVLSLQRPLKSPGAYAKQFKELLFPYHRSQTKRHIAAALTKRRWTT